MSEQIKISCLIPTWNEELRIRNVLLIAATHPLIDEIIVIDDGSTDATRAIVGELSLQFPKIRLISHEKNQGKTAAICTGIEKACGEFVLLLDADLVGLTEMNLHSLIIPVLSGEADVSISLRGNAPAPWQWISLDYISGERVLPREFLLQYTSVLRTLPKFGLESYMNKCIIKSNLKIKIVAWPDVESPWKYKKVGLAKGVWQDAIMILDIFRTITIFGPVYQIIRMKQLEVKK